MKSTFEFISVWLFFDRWVVIFYGLAALCCWLLQKVIGLWAYLLFFPFAVSFFLLVGPMNDWVSRLTRSDAWLTSKEGKAWLATNKGKAWLESPAGIRRRATEEGKWWFQTKDGTPKYTICIDADEEEDVALVNAWIERWKSQFTYFEQIGCGCCVWIYEVDCPPEAYAELPEDLGA
jgi:hypothetical protein